MLLVPAQTALVYDRNGWRMEWAPPAWWLDECEEQLLRDEQRTGVLRLVPPLPRQVTACRPGSGPCKRRHVHASPRRSQAG